MSTLKLRLSSFTPFPFIIFFFVACQITPLPAIPPPNSLEKSGGHLAYIGGDGNIYVTTADRQTTMAVTDDATAPREGAGLSYQRLAWSPDGQLAYASVTRTRNNASSKLYVKKSLAAPPVLIGESDDHFVIYIYWSPVSCPNRPDCRHLAYLIEESEDIGLHLVTLEDDKIDNRIIGFGWPYYYAWSPDGRSILGHTSGSVHDTPTAQLSLYQLGAEEPVVLPEKPATFQAPSWSPVDEGWLSVMARDGGGALQLMMAETIETITPVSSGGAAFVWSPTGQQVAYAVRANSNNQFYGPIHIFDRTTGQSSQLTDNGLQILAFFWDPAGERLGYLTQVVMPGEKWMQWRVYDLENDRDRGFKLFNPSLQMRFVMASFNQYAQSHRFWSPDGRYLVYASRDEILRREMVGLVDTWAEDGPETLVVAEGTMGFWSWQ